MLYLSRSSETTALFYQSTFMPMRLKIFLFFLLFPLLLLAQPTLTLTLTPSALMHIRGEVGRQVEAGRVHVVLSEPTGELYIVPSRSAAEVFTIDTNVIPAGTTEIDVTIYYEPKKIGKDKGFLYFMQGDNVLNQVQLAAMATDPATPPTLNVTPESVPAFTTTVGETQSCTFNVCPEGMPDYVNVELTQGTSSAFFISTTMIMPQGRQELVVSYRPLEAGTHTATLTLGNEFVDPIEIVLSGTATGMVAPLL